METDDSKLELCEFFTLVRQWVAGASHVGVFVKQILSKNYELAIWGLKQKRNLTADSHTFIICCLSIECMSSNIAADYEIKINLGRSCLGRTTSPLQ